MVTALGTACMGNKKCSRGEVKKKVVVCLLLGSCGSEMA